MIVMCDHEATAPHAATVLAIAVARQHFTYPSAELVHTCMVIPTPTCVTAAPAVVPCSAAASQLGKWLTPSGAGIPFCEPHR